MTQIFDNLEEKYDNKQIKMNLEDPLVREAIDIVRESGKAFYFLYPASYECRLQ